MLIAQITDCHLGFEPGNPEEPNRLRLDAVLRELAQGPNRPDAILASGDLVEHGDTKSYRQLAEAFARIEVPVLPMLGNHDARDAYFDVFSDAPREGGFGHHVHETDGLRLVVLDTLEEGRHGGGFCEGRQAWLAERLAEDRDTPTVIAMHHPPINSGIEWMETPREEQWVRRFAAALDGAANIRAIWSGHLHRPIMGSFLGIPVTVCPATAPPLTLDLSAIDPDRPDGRVMVESGPPGYALHRWLGGRLVTHFGFVEDRVALASYDRKMQEVVRHITGESD